jgi:hypothetical protein
MVKMIQEQITRLFKMLVAPKAKKTEAIYAPVWFPATRNKNDID